MLRTPLVFLLLGLIALAWWPGLRGAFLFDDYANLHQLEALNDEPSWYAIAQYVLGGKASALGRPLANLTFALQHASWDERPQDFLRINLILHLLNAALWFGVVARLQRLNALPAATLLPAAACAVWALLPIHGGAVLYVVQRMTLLATTCMLAGLLLYLAGRARATQQHWRHGYFLMSLGLALGTGLGSLAKETAALMPALVLALEATLLATVARPPHWRLWSGLFLWAPVALLAGYLWHELPNQLAGYESRPFSLAERLLTQARLLFAYLAKGLLPSLAGIRFHYDDFALSTSLLQPWTTLAALAGWGALVAAAVALRRRAPVFSFAVAWYLVGHALESSFIPLELAFDHRNYAPLLGPALALCVGWAWLLRQPQLLRLRRPLLAAGLAYVIGLGAGSAWSASLWGRPLEQAAFWVQRQPESRRAVYHYGDLLLRHGDASGAANLYQRALARWPSDTVLGLSLFNLRCDLAGDEPDSAHAAALLPRYDGNATVRVVGLLQGLADALEHGRCANHPAGEALPVVDAALESRWFAPHRVTLLHARARIQHAAGQLNEALASLEQALALDPQIPLLQWAVAWSLEAGDGARARRHLATAESDPRVPQRSRWIYREEIRGIRQMIELYESLERGAAA